MKIYHIFSVCYLITLCAAAATTAREEFFLCYDLIRYLKQYEKTGESKLVEQTFFNSIKNLDINSREYMELVYNKIAGISNERNKFENIYKDGDSISQVVERAVSEKKLTFGLNGKGLYVPENGEPRLKGYASIIERITLDLMEIYSIKGLNDIPRDIKFNMEKIRQEKYNQMKEALNSVEGYKGKIVASDSDWCFKDPQGNRITDFDSINKELGLGRRDVKLDKGHDDLIKLCTEKIDSMNNLQNGKCV